MNRKPRAKAFSLGPLYEGISRLLVCAKSNTGTNIYGRTLHITLTEQPDRENNSTTQGKKTTTTESRNNVEYFKDQTPSGSLHRGMDGAHRSARPGLYVFTSAEITEKAVKKHTACGDKMLHRGHFTLARKDTWRGKFFSWPLKYCINIIVRPIEIPETKSLKSLGINAMFKKKLYKD